MDEGAPLAKNLKATISNTESAIGSEALQPVILADKGEPQKLRAAAEPRQGALWG